MQQPQKGIDMAFQQSIYCPASYTTSSHLAVFLSLQDDGAILPVKPHGERLYARKKGLAYCLQTSVQDVS